MKASEARGLAEKGGRRGLPKILSCIKAAAREGDTGENIAADLVQGDPDSIVAELKRLGYKARYVLDQRDGDYYDVSW